jgi:geranylgeranyl diphosphate synthase, type I
MTITSTTLRRSQDIVTPALRAAVDRLDQTTRTWAGYHFGWWTPEGNPTGAGGGGGGKAVRPALALLSAQAASAPADVGLPGAVAVELVHNFSLLHDDLMDGDALRRHRRTVWALWGSASAILTGDALLALAQEVLLTCQSPHAGRASTLLAVATRDLVRGQVQDMSFERRRDVTLDACFDMAAGKTGALLSASASIGAVLAGGAADIVAALSRFGAELGIAFQLVDDLLGIWGDPAVTGKPVYSDLRTRKKTLPVTYAATGAGAAGGRLATWLAGTGPVDKAVLQTVAALVDEAGGREWATREATRRLESAVAALDAVPLAREARDELVALGQFIVDREV